MILTENSKVLSHNGNILSYVPQLYYYPGATLSGWTNAANSEPPSIDLSIGNPSPSFKLTGRGMLRDLGVTFHNKTITFDMRPGTSFDGGFSFANASNGNGTYRAGLQMKQSATAIAGQGLRAGSNGGWLYFGVGAPETLSLFTSTTTWYSIKIRITSSGFCTWFVDGLQQSSTYKLSSSYTTANTTNNYYGFIINGPNTGTYFDNLVIYSGII
jgi:hypothetical protein